MGVTAGPLLGGFLFQVGGFSLPFELSAAAHLFFVAVSMASLLCRKTAAQESVPDVESTSQASSASESGSELSVTICSIASLRLMMLAGISCLCLGVWGAFEPLLGDHFMNVLGLTDHTIIGFLMSLAAVPSTFAAMAVPKLVKLVGAKWLMFGGLGLYACGAFSLGSWQLLRLDFHVKTGQPRSPWASQLAGLLLIGCGWGLCWTPVLPSMMDQAASKLESPAARHLVSPSVASIFNASAALGEAMGPLLGTWLLHSGRTGRVCFEDLF